MRPSSIPSATALPTAAASASSVATQGSLVGAQAAPALAEPAPLSPRLAAHQAAPAGPNQAEPAPVHTVAVSPPESSSQDELLSAELEAFYAGLGDVECEQELTKRAPDDVPSIECQRSRFEATNCDNADLLQQIASLRQQKAHQDAEIAALRHKNALLEEQVADLGQMIQTLSGQNLKQTKGLEDALGTLHQFVALAANFQQRNKVLMDQLEDQQAQIQALANQLVHLNHQLAAGGMAAELIRAFNERVAALLPEDIRGHFWTAVNFGLGPNPDLNP